MFNWHTPCKAIHVPGWDETGREVAANTTWGVLGIGVSKTGKIAVTRPDKINGVSGMCLYLTKMIYELSVFQAQSCLEVAAVEKWIYF